MSRGGGLGVAVMRSIMQREASAAKAGKRNGWGRSLPREVRLVGWKYTGLHRSLKFNTFQFLF